MRREYCSWHTWAWSEETQLTKSGREMIGKLPILLVVAGVGSGSPLGADQVGEVFRDCDVCPEMVVVPAGSFMMGPEGDSQRRVSIG